MLDSIAQAIAGSDANEAALYLLRNVPGLPPIVQTIHILAIAALMASVAFVALRSLGLALPSQDLREMVRRLMPWTWWALPVLLLSGGLLVLARPQRYFSNPVMGWKMLFLLAALVLSVLMVQRIRRSASNGFAARPLRLKLMAAGVLFFWVLTVLAGRWIAYSDYLFLPA